MANTHFYGLIGDAHVKGTRPSAVEAGSTTPIVLGKSEQMLEFLDLGFALGSLAVNDIVEQIPLGLSIRSRIVKILANTGVAATVIVEPVSADAAGPGALWPGPEGSSDPVYLWDTWSPVNINFGASATRQITQVTRSQLPEQLNDPTLDFVTDDVVFWDPQAKKARKITVSGYTATPNTNYMLPGDQITTSGGATFIVVGVAANNTDVWIARLTGTLTVGHTLTNDQASRNLSGVAITNVGTATTAGDFVRYSPMPSLGRRITTPQVAPETAGDYLANEWEVPPRGNGKTGVAGFGPDARIVANAVAYHKQAADPTDRGVRLYTFGGDEASVLGGVTIQRVDVTGLTGTFTAGQVVTSSGTGWSATVVGTNGTSILMVASTNGVTLTASETITGPTGSATSTGAAQGWQKGSTNWNAVVAELATAMASPNALSGGAAAKWEHLFMMVWEGEISPYGAIGTTGGILMVNYMLTHPELQRQQWSRFIADLRTHLGRADLPIAVWAHHPGSQSGVLTGAGVSTGLITSGVRSLIKSLPTFIAGVRVVDSYDRGHQMQKSNTSPDSDLFLRTLDYIDLGNAFWHLIAPTLPAPFGNYQVLPIIVVTASQSQMRGFNVFKSESGVGWAYVDKDPEKWPSIDFIGANGLPTDTRDPNVLVWNGAARQLQVYDVARNENTLWQSNSTDPTSGPLPPLIQRMKARFGPGGGASGKIGIFKFAVSGSCYSPTLTDQAGCWHPSLTVRPAIGPVSITVTHVTVGGSQYARLTATAGTFSAVTNLHTITIEGGAGTQGAGGRNTPAYQFNKAITTQSPDGTFIDVPDSAGTLIPNGTETLTIRVGPPPIWPEMVSQWREFIRATLEAGYIPHPVVIGTEQGESDFGDAANYAQHLDDIWTALIDLCALRNPTGGDVDIAKFIVLAHKFSPFTQNASLIDVVRDAQIAKAASMTNCVVVDPSELPFEVNDFGLILSTPPYPRQYRLENGVHHTGAAMLTKGLLIDRALGTLTNLIPAHPTAPDVTAFGAVVGVGRIELTDGGGEGAGDDGPGTPGPDGLIVEDGTGYDNADSFVSVADADTVLAQYGVPASWTAATTDTKAQALRRAVREYLDGIYGSAWRGTIAVTTQRLSWPRFGAFDDDSRLVPTGTIPWQIVHAQVLVAADIIDGGVILPSGYKRGQVIRETNRGAGFEKTIEYAAGTGDGDSSIRRLRAADALIYPFVDSDHFAEVLRS